MNDVVDVAFIVLSLLNGAPVMVNPRHITSLQTTSEALSGEPNPLVGRGARCVVVMTSGRRYAVAETCSAIQDKIEDLLK